ncbi:hypothetical protein SLE2022_055010 [Rubroshorea leprosula]
MALIDMTGFLSIQIQIYREKTIEEEEKGEKVFREGMRRMQGGLTRSLLRGVPSGAGCTIGQQQTMTQYYDTSPFLHTCNNDSYPSLETSVRNPQGFPNTTASIHLIRHTLSIILHGSSVYSDEFEFSSL